MTVERAAEHADRALPDPRAGLGGVADPLGAVDRLLAVAVVVTVLTGVDRQAVVAEGLTLPSWLRAVAGRTGGDAGMLVAAAGRLAAMPAVLTALQTGVLSWGTVRGIVAATRNLTAAQRGWVDTTLTADGDRRGRVDGDTIIADTQALADRARPDLHADHTDRTTATQQLVLQPAVDGSGGTLVATLDAESFAAVTAAIDGITRDSTGRRTASNIDALRTLARHRTTTTDDRDGGDADRVGESHGGDGGGERRVRPAPSTARPEVIVVTDIRLLTNPDTDVPATDRPGRT